MSTDKLHNATLFDCNNFATRLNSIARLAYGSGIGEGESGGKGNIGLVGDKVVKFNTKKGERDNLAHINKDSFVYTNMKESCDALRQELRAMVLDEEYVGLDKTAQNVLLKKLGFMVDDEMFVDSSAEQKGTVADGAGLLDRTTVADVLKALVKANAANEKRKVADLNKILWNGHEPTYGSSVESFREAVNANKKEQVNSSSGEYARLYASALQSDDPESILKAELRNNIGDYCQNIKKWFANTCNFMRGLMPVNSKHSRAYEKLGDKLNEGAKKFNEHMEAFEKFVSLEIKQEKNNDFIDNLLANEKKPGGKMESKISKINKFRDKQKPIEEIAKSVLRFVKDSVFNACKDNTIDAKEIKKAAVEMFKERWEDLKKDLEKDKNTDSDMRWRIDYYLADLFEKKLSESNLFDRTVDRYKAGRLDTDFNALESGVFETINESVEKTIKERLSRLDNDWKDKLKKENNNLNYTSLFDNDSKIGEKLIEKILWGRNACNDLEGFVKLGIAKLKEDFVGMVGGLKELKFGDKYYPDFNNKIDSKEKVPEEFQDIYTDIKDSVDQFKQTLDSISTLQGNVAGAVDEKQRFNKWHKGFEDKLNEKAAEFDQALEIEPGQNRQDAIDNLAKNADLDKLKKVASSLYEMQNVTYSTKGRDGNYIENIIDLREASKVDDPDSIKNVQDFRRFVEGLVRARRSSAYSIFDRGPSLGDTLGNPAIPQKLVYATSVKHIKSDMEKNNNRGRIITTSLAFFDRLRDVAMAFNIINDNGSLVR